MFKIKNKKAQAWGTDLTIAFIIFTLAIVFFYFYSFNYSNETEDILDTLNYEGNFIADSLFSPGSPEDWTENNVIKPGITTDGKINQTKLQMFYNLARTDYNHTKTFFNTKYDFYFFTEQNLTLIPSAEGIGKPNINSTTIQAQNLFKVTRFTIYQNKPLTAYLYIFQE